MPGHLSEAKPRQDHQNQWSKTQRDTYVGKMQPEESQWLMMVG